MWLFWFSSILDVDSDFAAFSFNIKEINVWGATYRLFY